MKRVSQKRSTCCGRSRSLGDLADGPEGVRALVHRSVDGTAFTRPRRSPSPPLMRAFSTLDGLNTMTRRGSIGTSTPVFGLRPTRCALVAHDEGAERRQLHGLAPARQSQISLSTSSTERRRFRPRQADLPVHGLAQIGARHGPACHQPPPATSSVIHTNAMPRTLFSRSRRSIAAAANLLGRWRLDGARHPRATARPHQRRARCPR